LRQKELDCERLQKEIDALRLAIPLLADEPGHVTEESEGQEGQEPMPSLGQTSSGSSFWRRRKER
jgi:hypothetical protein